MKCLTFKNMDNLFQTSAFVEKVQTMADRTLQLRIAVQELPPEDMTKLMSLYGKQGWFLFKENPFEEKELPKETAPEFKQDRSPAERLRACLYVYWDTNTGKKQDFDVFWRNWINKKCEEIKATLPEKE